MSGARKIQSWLKAIALSAILLFVAPAIADELHVYYINDDNEAVILVIDANSSDADIKLAATLILEGSKILIVLDGNGGVNEYVGGYSDWEARGGSLSGVSTKPLNKPPGPAKDSPKAEQKLPSEKKQKLSYKLQRELGNLPGIIEKLENQQSQLEQKMSTPEFYKSDQEKVQLVSREFADVKQQLENAYSRWDELEEIK